MKIIFLLLSIPFILIMLVFAFLLFRRKDPLAKALCTLNIGAIVSTVIYILSILNFPYNISMFFNGCYYSSVHWLLLLFINFLFILTETPVKATSVQAFFIISKIIAALDTASLLLNVYTHHAFTLTPYINDGSFYCWVANYKFAFIVHLVLCYILCAIIFFGLIKKTVQTSRFYRAKYFTEFLILLFVVLFNAGFLIAKLKFDFSMLTYCFFSMASTYFAFYSVPRKIETAMLQLVSDNISNGICCFDKDRKIIYTNKIAADYFPVPGNLTSELERFLSSGEKKDSRNSTIVYKGFEKILHETFQVITDNSDKIIGYFISFEDITDELKSINEEQFRATHDSLTGLYNRENFFLEAEKILHNDPDTPRYLVCTNIKNFKLINDLYGSIFADNLLKKQVSYLSMIPGEDTLKGRISGDKFAMLIQKKYFDEKKAIENTSYIQQYTSELNYKLHIYIGVYEISDPFEKVPTMYDKANLAIKNINSDYSISLAYYNTELLNLILKDKNVVANFESALENGQFKMYLQPQVTASDEKCVGAEALVRWVHPEQGIITPQSFVPTLESTGYLYKLDQYIWTEAAKTLAKWKSQGIDKYIAVNISPKDFYYLDIYKIFVNLVRKYEIDPSRLKLEITESVLMHDLNMNNNILERLREFGFSIEMDDFGSGYSSLNMLKNMNVDILKIDMTFIHQTSNIQRSQTILKVFIKMAKTMGMKIIMEGVEDETHQKFLKELGCDFFQGYLFSRPVPLEEFENTYNREAQ